MAKFMTMLEKAMCWDNLRGLADKHTKEAESDPEVKDSAEALTGLIVSIEAEVMKPVPPEKKE